MTELQTPALDNPGAEMLRVVNETLQLAITAGTLAAVGAVFIWAGVRLLIARQERR